ncbi:hypothetical protein [Amycolatopsis sp. NPDC051128]|uniref:hypothetical protein n=1 Tax=Amycolatopsis sp. NPDC051128 TaxID=3155412 RepID=UPI00343FC1E7
MNDDAAGTPSSRAATAPHGQALSWTISWGRTRLRSASTAGSSSTVAPASAATSPTGVGGSGSGWSPPG